MRPEKKMTKQYVTSIALSAFLLAGCAVGPDFVPPEKPAEISYVHGLNPMITAQAKGALGEAQRFVAADIPASWWHLFESAELNNIITRAMTANPDLDAARAALRGAQETVLATQGGFWPALDGSSSAGRNKTSSSSKPFALYNSSVAIAYAPDVFGATSRAVESKEAAAEAKSFELEAAYLTLTGNVVTTAIQEASLREQVEATRSIIADETKQLDLMKLQLEAGAIARQSLLSQQSLLATTKASLPALEQQLTATRNLMAVLMGQLPSHGVPASFTLTSFKLPTAIPLSLPSKLVDQRPDIRAALANLHAANADIGVATAAMFPQITLSASYGISAASAADLFSPTTALWGLAAGISQPLFHGGELLHTKRAKQAAFDQAAAQYRSTVLSAFEDVANTLKALESDAQALQAQVEAEQAAAQSLELTRQQFNAGAINAIDLLSAQTTYQQTKIALIKAKAARLTDTAALFTALGGGWWNRTEDKLAAR